MKPDYQYLASLLAERGRKTDDEVGHLTSGEVIIPRNLVADPEVIAVLEEIFQQRGMDLERYMVGSPENSINPATGAREFFGSDAERDFEEAQGQFGGAGGNEPGWGGGSADRDGGGGGMSASQYNSAISSGSYGGMTKDQFTSMFGPPSNPMKEFEAAQGMFGGAVGNEPGAGDRHGVSHDGNDPRGRQDQRGFYNAGVGDGSKPQPDFWDDLLDFFGVTQKHTQAVNPNTGKPQAHNWDTEWGLELNPLGMAVGAATGPLGLLAGPAAGYLAKKAGAPTVGVSKSGLTANSGTWFDGDVKNPFEGWGDEVAGWFDDPSNPLTGWGEIASSGGPLSDDGAPFGNSPAQQQAVQQPGQQAFVPPPTLEPPAWLTYPTAMNDRQKRSYLATQALYGNNGNFRGEDVYRILASLLQNAAYTDQGEQRALEDYLLPAERSYLTDVRGKRAPSTTEELLAMLEGV